MLLTKVYNAWAKKVIEEFDGTETDAKFEGNWLALTKNFRLQAEK